VALVALRVSNSLSGRGRKFGRHATTVLTHDARRIRILVEFQSEATTRKKNFQIRPFSIISYKKKKRKKKISALPGSFYKYFGVSNLFHMFRVICNALLFDVK
jgi:hypothetical protein